MGAAGEAAYVTAPRANRVIRVDVTTTEGAFAIPADFAGMPCEWVVYGTDADIVFGISTVEVAYDAESDVTDGVITHDDDIGRRLKDGVPRYWVMPAIVAGETTHFSVDAVGTGKLEISISGGM